MKIKKRLTQLTVKKAISPIIATILLLGLAIVLAITIFLWQTRQVEELSESAVNFVEGGMQCENVFINALITDQNTCTVKVFNDGLWNIEKLNIQKLYNAAPANLLKDVTLEPKSKSQSKDKYTTTINTGYCGEVQLVPIIKIKESLAACKNKIITVNCPPCQGPEGTACEDDTPSGSCSLDKPGYCENGVLYVNCEFCGCPVGKRCGEDDNCEEEGLKCSDTTLYGSCSSTTKSSYCDSYGNLKTNYCYGQDKVVGNSDDCGCPEGKTCSSDGNCEEQEEPEEPEEPECTTNEVGLCNDDLDNDCDGESDYDSSDGLTGDSDCPVGVAYISVSSNIPVVGSNINVYCTSTTAGVDSISASVDDVACSFVDWSYNVANFSCNVGSSAGSKTVKCFVDTAKSYAVSGKESITTPITTFEVHKGCSQEDIYWIDTANRPRDLIQDCGFECDYWPLNSFCYQRSDGKVEVRAYPECFYKRCQLDDKKEPYCDSDKKDYPPGVENIEYWACNYIFTINSGYENKPGYWWIGKTPSPPLTKGEKGFCSNADVYIDPDHPKIINCIEISGLYWTEEGVLERSSKSGLAKPPCRILTDLIPFYEENNIKPYQAELCSNTCSQKFSDSFFYTDEDFLFARCV